MLRALPRDHVTPVLGDAANVTLGRTFALILAAGIFEFVAPPRVLANAAAHAAPGARLVVLHSAPTLAGRALRTFMPVTASTRASMPRKSSTRPR